MQTDSIQSIKERLSEIEEEKKKLEAEMKELSEGFKVGDWVRNRRNSVIYQIQEVHHDDTCHGFETWYRAEKGKSAPHSYKKHNLTRLTNDEVRAELMKRAKDAGFINGARFRYGSIQFILDYVTIAFDLLELGHHNSKSTRDYLKANNYVVVLVATSRNCCPMHRSVLLPPPPKYPKINGYDGKENNDFFIYGCAVINKHLIRDLNAILLETYTGNRSVASVTLNSGATLTKQDITELAKTLTT